MESDRFSILDSVSVLFGMLEEIVATSLLGCLSNKGKG